MWSVNYSGGNILSNFFEHLVIYIDVNKISSEVPPLILMWSLHSVLKCKSICFFLLSDECHKHCRDVKTYKIDCVLNGHGITSYVKNLWRGGSLDLPSTLHNTSALEFPIHRTGSNRHDLTYFYSLHLKSSLKGYLYLVSEQHSSFRFVGGK